MAHRHTPALSALSKPRSSDPSLTETFSRTISGACASLPARMSPLMFARQAAGRPRLAVEMP